MGSESAMLEWELTGQVLAAAIAVHTALGPGFLETIYDNALVVELKAVKALLPEHFAVVRSYLQATGCPVGLLLNFNKRVLEAKRVFPHDGRAL